MVATVILEGMERNWLKQLRDISNRKYIPSTTMELAMAGKRIFKCTSLVGVVQMGRGWLWTLASREGGWKTNTWVIY